MSLKDLTAERHALAEETPFMKAVFNGTMTREAWQDFTFQKYLIYDVLEIKADEFGLLSGIEEIKRAPLLKEDYDAMTSAPCEMKTVVKQYFSYIRQLHDPVKVMAHIYVWHMGDLFGGQMIKKVVDAPHKSLDFTDPAALKEGIRAKLNDNMGDEANVAFDWAIRILNTYQL